MDHEAAPQIYVGTAAWAVPKAYQSSFPLTGTHLERYSRALNGVEINSSFYRDHQAVTYERWAESVPEDFRFAVKVSRDLTHDQRLQEGPETFREKWQAIRCLGRKLGALLVQLPPSLDFRAEHAKAFFGEMREVYSGPLALEPRHPTWTHDAAAEILREFRVSRVLADPEPGGVPNPEKDDFPDFVYIRLHGSPKIYQSDYEAERLEDHAQLVLSLSRTNEKIWCIYDNTTFGFATANALDLSRRLGLSKKETGPLPRKEPPELRPPL